MSPSNLTIQASVREYQKYFNQAFNEASASADVTYSSTQTITGGLVVCRNFTVNAAVVLTVTNPTTIVCQTFTNNGTITMSPVADTVLAPFRASYIASAPHAGGTITVFPSVPSQGWLASNAFTGSSFTAPVGTGTVGLALWWPFAFANPVFSQRASIGNNGSGQFLTASLAYQRNGGYQATTPPSPGSFLEVFSRGAISISGSISASAAAGAANQGGSGGGCVGFYSESSIVQSAGTISCSGSAPGSANYGGGGSYGTGGVAGATANGGGGGGGGQFYIAPIVTLSGTRTVSGGAALGASASPGNAGLILSETRSRLWMPGEDDIVAGTRYSAT